MEKILVANRGEIALRIMRSAREMGIKTVAVYSDADRKSPHVFYADEAVHIGPPSSSASYLSFDKILNAAKITAADAIHPGYGFLSENASFAREVKKAGLIFIGPSPESMEIMGSKLGAKAAVKKYRIPMVPGTDEAINDFNAAQQIAEQIGYPLLIKASAGGGGKGMRIVEKPEQLQEMLKMATHEATSSFGDGAVFIEKYIASPRHIEIQVLGDLYGNTVHLFERECSIQRRHQKIIEEAPSSVLDEQTRMEMGACAVTVAKACNYAGAGTVEFLLDENRKFYFLEMNTRLQVEHPVTEQITGLDLVKEQIKVARGEKLSFTQEDLKIQGHSLEIRVYAEDPSNNFLPDTGRLFIYNKPQGPGVRVDDGYEEGMDIPIYYDSMIAKLITFGSNRTEAIIRMIRAIDEYTINGVKTTLPFCKFVLQHPAFTSGNFDTHFIEKYFSEYHAGTANEEGEEIAAIVATCLAKQSITSAGAHEKQVSQRSKWKDRNLE
jgi:acetyl-CoA carboxylase biotin carboxylase subunit